MNTEFTIKKSVFTSLFQGGMKEMLQLFGIIKNLWFLKLYAVLSFQLWSQHISTTITFTSNKRGSLGQHHVFTVRIKLYFKD